MAGRAELGASLRPGRGRRPPGDRPVRPIVSRIEFGPCVDSECGAGEAKHNESHGHHPRVLHIPVDNKRHLTVIAVGRLGNAIRAALVRYRRRFLPALSLMCILAGVFIAFAGVRDARAHNAALRQLFCERQTKRLAAAGWKTFPCSEVKHAPSLQLVGDRDIWTPILMGGYVATFGAIVLVVMLPRRRAAHTDRR